MHAPVQLQHERLSRHEVRRLGRTENPECEELRTCIFLCRLGLPDKTGLLQAGTKRHRPVAPSGRRAKRQTGFRVRAAANELSGPAPLPRAASASSPTLSPASITRRRGTRWEAKETRPFSTATYPHTPSKNHSPWPGPIEINTAEPPEYAPYKQALINPLSISSPPYPGP